MPLNVVQIELLLWWQAGRGSIIMILMLMMYATKNAWQLLQQKKPFLKVNLVNDDAAIQNEVTKIQN